MRSVHRLLLASKKNLLLKCSACSQLLPSAHFPNINGPKHTLVCCSCKRLCINCGHRLPLSDFHSEKESCVTCRRCEAKEVVARENVYFRYPVLKYRACPFSVDEMRSEIQREQSLSLRPTERKATGRKIV